MANAISAPLTDGQTIAVQVGGVIVSVQAVRPGYAYRVRVAHAGGLEIERLCRSFPREDTARGIARVITVLLRGGYSVAELLDLADVFTAPAA